jgi:hypothetical protein
MFQVYPLDLVTTRTIGSFRIDQIQLVLFKQANISVVLYDTNGVAFELKQLQMTGADYDMWSTDDNYVLQFVCTQLGLTVKEPEPVVVPEPVVPVEEPVVPVEEPVVPVEEPVVPAVEEPVVPAVEEPAP